MMAREPPNDSNQRNGEERQVEPKDPSPWSLDTWKDANDHGTPGRTKNPPERIDGADETYPGETHRTRQDITSEGNGDWQ